MGPISIYQKSCRILTILDLHQILMFNTAFKCELPVYRGLNRICDYYTNLREEVISKQTSILESLEIERDKNSVHDTLNILYGSLNTDDLHLYMNIPLPIPQKFQMNSTLIINSTFASTFPAEFEKVQNLIKYSLYQTDNISRTNLLFNEWKTEMDILNLAVLLSRTGKIHPSIFTPDNLISALKNLKPYFNEAVVPLELESQNYEDIISISDLKIIIWDNKLIYDLQIPVIEPENYRLYRLVPWPMKLTNDDIHFFIEPTEDFVAIKAHDHLYIPFKEDELQTCRRTKQKKFCSVSSLIIDFKMSNTCELSLISNNYKNNLFSICTVKLIKFRGTVWHRLKNENTWIFTSSKDSINVTCLGKKPVAVSLENSGWIKLNKSCVATSDKVTLKPLENNFENIDKTQFQFFKYNLASDVEKYIKDLNIQLNEIILYDFGNRGYLDLGDLKLMGTSLDRIQIEAVKIGKEKGKEETGSQENRVINKSRDLLVIEFNNLKKNQRWLWTFGTVLYLISVCYILYETQVIKRVWIKVKNRGRKRSSVLENQEFSARHLFPKEESILSESDNVSAPVQNAERLHTEENLLRSWPSK